VAADEALVALALALPSFVQSSPCLPPHATHRRTLPHEPTTALRMGRHPTDSRASRHSSVEELRCFDSGGLSGPSAHRRPLLFFSPRPELSTRWTARELRVPEAITVSDRVRTPLAPCRRGSARPGESEAKPLELRSDAGDLAKRELDDDRRLTGIHPRRSPAARSGSCDARVRCSPARRDLGCPVEPVWSLPIVLSSSPSRTENGLVAEYAGPFTLAVFRAATTTSRDLERLLPSPCEAPRRLHRAHRGA